MLKRTFDVLMAGAAIIALGPLLLPVTIILALTGEHEIFYRQARVGRGGRVFNIYKFATMLKDSARLSGGDITTANDPRVLPFGRFLRRTKINEIPQLLNVLLGDMSLIGYRPLTPRVAALFPKGYWIQLREVRPGLSGIGSIVFRDEESLLNMTSDREKTYVEVVIPYKSALELWYVRHQGLTTDIKLIMLTLCAIWKPGLEVSNFIADLPDPPAALTAQLASARRLAS